MGRLRRRLGGALDPVVDGIFFGAVALGLALGGAYPLWLAGLVVQGLLADDEAAEMAHACAYGLAKRAYRVPSSGEVTS